MAKKNIERFALKKRVAGLRAERFYRVRMTLEQRFPPLEIQQHALVLMAKMQQVPITRRQLAKSVMFLTRFQIERKKLNKEMSKMVRSGTRMGATVHDALLNALAKTQKNTREFDELIKNVKFR